MWVLYYFERTYPLTLYSHVELIYYFIKHLQNRFLCVLFFFFYTSLWSSFFFFVLITTNCWNAQLPSEIHSSKLCFTVKNRWRSKLHGVPLRWCSDSTEQKSKKVCLIICLFLADTVKLRNFLVLAAMVCNAAWHNARSQKLLEAHSHCSLWFLFMLTVLSEKKVCNRAHTHTHRLPVVSVFTRANMVSCPHPKEIVCVCL